MFAAVEFLSQIESTQTYIKKLCEQNLTLPHVVATENQTHGYGRFKRQWVAPNGNLSFSIALPAQNMASAPQISLVLAMSLARVLKIETRIKWPNDVGIWRHKQFYKMAGILAETHQNFFILGAGLNLNSTAKDFAPELTACTLLDMTHQTTNAQEFLHTLLEQFKHDFTAWQTQGFTLTHKFILSRLLYLNQQIWIIEGTHKTPCTLLGLNLDGSLLIRDESQNTRSLFSAEVSLRPT